MSYTPEELKRTARLIREKFTDPNWQAHSRWDANAQAAYEHAFRIALHNTRDPNFLRRWRAMHHRRVELNP